MTRATPYRPNRSRCRVWPWDTMGVGQDIWVSDEDGASSARVASYLWGNRNGAKFTTRRENGGVTIKRIK